MEKPDIVERLRDWEDDEAVKMFAAEILKDTSEAADKIKEMRLAIRALLSFPGGMFAPALERQALTALGTSTLNPKGQRGR